MSVSCFQVKHFSLITEYHARGLCAGIQFNMKWMVFVRICDWTDKCHGAVLIQDIIAQHESRTPAALFMSLLGIKV